MATCLAICNRALRLARIVAIGDEPSSSELDEAMTVLRSFYQRLADTALRPDSEVYETEDYTADEGERIYCTGTVTLPDLIEDGSERRVKDLASVQYKDETEDAWQTWISDKGDWVRIDDLEESDTAPLSDRNMDGLSCLVAMEVAGTFGSLADIDPITVKKAARFQSQMQPRNDDPVEYY
jgi:hypothetical protein